MSFLNLEGKTFLITGLANKKSVGWHVARTLKEQGAKVVYSVRSAARKESVAALTGDDPVYVCDFENPSDIDALAAQAAAHAPFAGLLHSVAWANYAEGMKPFHETKRADFLQAATISAFSLVELARAFKPHLTDDASVVALGISSQVTAENYGYTSPIKAALESCARFLAKSFSKDTRVRFNTVNAGPLKTSASAGIPGYMDNYLYAEKMTMRKQALKTQEVADVAVFLLSERSSGVNAQGVTVNAGMDINYFDAEIVRLASRPE